MADMAETMGFAHYMVSVRDCRCVVVRRVDSGKGAFTYEAASNWPELEAEAEGVVEDFGGAFNVSGLYPCPRWLAERAVWPEKEREHER